MNCQAKQDYAGTYRIRDVEIRYSIPTVLLGAPAFMRIEREFRDERHCGIFSTSYANDLDGKPHPALSLDIAPAPKDIIWTEEAGPYAKYYDEKLAKMGLIAKTETVMIGGRKWLRIQQFFPSGNLVRVLYVTKLFEDLNLVCRMGILDNGSPEHKELHASQWSGQVESVLQSLTIIRCAGPN